ncbi:hypothetical protein ISF_01214 [Cordyceps fumosorosea ARSEF 2679]|uniref:Uncharacterized protein n=1 Tax=Cordyceps fumosorosea (strain ARSEF 2679) TaxID=1081104 RepID=A0A168D3X1_CORFA|nr:hypothetical protein ISF_01214 [Cordyceps fumosorosea ARSEF 2679]OAA72141.1 hypothetical protein ISF_01214 [Cordyceps fumosorosea ARSEF 2679]
MALEFKKYCVGSAEFEPSTVAGDDSLQARIGELLKEDDLLGASRVLFKLPENDGYIYHATASVSLAQVQHILQLGDVNGLHDWYKNIDGTRRDAPSRADTAAYTSIFDPKTATLSALKNFKTNAKKDSTLKILADGRNIADIGSGNGYWSYMLRAYGLKCHPVDNLQSIWRVSWVDDTAVSEGVNWLKRHENGKQMVLLLVYPVVGGSISGGVQGAFTRNLVNAYDGDTIAVVGTQNQNGYTGFKGLTMAEYMEKEQPHWIKVVQIPLPSFGGKDEALFIFQRGERVSYLETELNQ